MNTLAQPWKAWLYFRYAMIKEEIYVLIGKIKLAFVVKNAAFKNVKKLYVLYKFSLKF